MKSCRVENISYTSEVVLMFNLSRNLFLYFLVVAFNFGNAVAACKAMVIPHHYKLNSVTGKPLV